MTAPPNPTAATLADAVAAGAEALVASITALWDVSTPGPATRLFARRYAEVVLAAAAPILAAGHAGQLAQSVARECTALCNDLEQDRDEWEVRALKAETALAQAHAAGTAAGTAEGAAGERERIAVELADWARIASEGGPLGSVWPCCESCAEKVLDHAAAIARAGMSEVTP